MTDVAADRARIEEEVGGRTLIDVLADTVAEHADGPAYSDKHHVPDGESWRTFTWTDVRERGLDVAAGLIGLGAQVGDTIAIMATNRIEHYVADVGAVHAAATPMSIYNTLSQEQVAYVAGESTPVVAVLENADHLARWDRAIAEGYVKHVVLIDASAAPDGDDRFLSWDELLAAGAERRAAQPDELEQRHAVLDPDAPATILYTSGTTGNPKGVVLTHHNVLYESVSTLEAAGLDGLQRMVSYLPLAHIAERVLGLYGPLMTGTHAHAIGDPAELLAALGEVHPTGFFGVPRVWEKIKTGISAKLAADDNPDNVKMVRTRWRPGWPGSRPRRSAAP